MTVSSPSSHPTPCLFHLGVIIARDFRIVEPRLKKDNILNNCMDILYGEDLARCQGASLRACGGLGALPVLASLWACRGGLMGITFVITVDGWLEEISSI